MKKFFRGTAVLTALLTVIPLLSAAAPTRSAGPYIKTAPVSSKISVSMRRSAQYSARYSARYSALLTLLESPKSLLFRTAASRTVAPLTLPSSFAQYRTSCLSNNGPEYLKATANGSTVHVAGYNPVLKNIFASTNTPALGITKRNLFTVTNGAFAFDITMTPPNGSYPLYFGTQTSDGSYAVLYVMLATYRQGSWSFPVSPVYQNNLDAVNGITADDEFRKEISYADVARIVALSDQICAGLTDDYAKLRALHDWVAKNISYDYDAITNNTIDANGLNTLKNKRGVCGGYADLYEMLCEAQGLKVYESIGIAADSSDDFPTNPQYGHEWNLAFADGRWMNIDTTWDSFNTYKNAAYTPGDPQDIYFDATDEYFAQDHKTYSIAKPDTIIPTFDTPVYSPTAVTSKNVTVTVRVADATQPVMRRVFTQNGTYTFNAADRFGKFSTVLTIHVTNIDKTRPVIKTSIGKLQSTKGRVTVTVSDPHLAAKSVTRNGKRIAWPSGGSFTLKGTYTVTAVDTPGNKAASSFRITG